MHARISEQELELTFEAETFEDHEDNSEFQDEEGFETEFEGDFQWPKQSRFRGPPPDIIRAGPPQFKLPICRAAYSDLADLAALVGTLKRALARKPVDRHRVHNARLDVSHTVDQMIAKLRRGGHYAKTSCGQRDLAGLKERLKSLRLGLPQSDQNVLNRAIFFARAASQS
jgi:hypothetical protein